MNEHEHEHEHERWMTLVAARARGEALDPSEQSFCRAFEAEHPEFARERALWVSFGLLAAPPAMGASTTTADAGVGELARSTVARFHRLRVLRWVGSLGIGAGVVAAVAVGVPRLTHDDPRAEEPVVEARVVPGGSSLETRPEAASDEARSEAPDHAVDEASAEAPKPPDPATLLEAKPESTSASDIRRKPTKAAAPPRPSATDMLRAAQRALGEDQQGPAEAHYEALVVAYPETSAAASARLTLAELALSSGDPTRALAFYDGYLEHQGPLVEEAERGRARALRALGRAADERAAIEGFLHAHPESSYRAEFEARLDQL